MLQKMCKKKIMEGECGAFYQIKCQYRTACQDDSETSVREYINLFCDPSCEPKMEFKI